MSTVESLFKRQGLLQTWRNRDQNIISTVIFMVNSVVQTLSVRVPVAVETNAARCSLEIWFT